MFTYNTLIVTPEGPITIGKIYEMQQNPVHATSEHDAAPLPTVEYGGYVVDLKHVVTHGGLIECTRDQAFHEDHEVSEQLIEAIGGKPVFGIKGGCEVTFAGGEKAVAL